LEREMLADLLSERRNVSSGGPSLALLSTGAVTVHNDGSSPATLKRLASEADLLSACAGVPGLISREHVKRGAVVVNVGTTVEVDSPGALDALVTDVDAHGIGAQASLLVASPGGVGPLPLAVLLRGTARARASRALQDAHAEEDDELLNADEIIAELSSRDGWTLDWCNLDEFGPCPQETVSPTVRLQEIDEEGGADVVTCLRKMYRFSSLAEAAEAQTVAAALCVSIGHHTCSLRFVAFSQVEATLTTVASTRKYM